MESPPFVFRCLRSSDHEACLALFDANCPEFFAPNERADYAAWLTDADASYTVVQDGDAIVGAFGLVTVADDRGAIHWIMISPTHHGCGLGSSMMRCALDDARTRNLALIEIAASQHSAPFFARFGAAEVEHTADGWGPGMHRVDMELAVSE